MRVGVHLEALRPGEIGGLEHYVRHLLAAMGRLDGELTFVLFCAEHNAATFAEGPGIEKLVLPAEGFAALDAEALAAHRLDLWFCPLLVLEPASSGLPSVATIPDLQHEVYPEFFTPEILDWRRSHYRRTARSADRILTLSEFSRDQILGLLGAEEERVVVTYLDAAPELAAPANPEAATLDGVRARYGLAGDYFFYPGAGWPHKNHRTLFEALAKLKELRPEVPQLALTGAQVEGAVDLAAESRRLGLEGDVKRLGYVPAADLPGLYAASLATVFPSLFEGFGIPVVEAMRAGSPVICSRAASLPEVAGDAAVYFDPHRPDELCARLDAFCAAAADGGRAVFHSRASGATFPSSAPGATVERSLSDLRQAGRRQARKFSWRRTAAVTREAFRAAVREFEGRRASVPSPEAPAAGTRPAADASDVRWPAITVVTPSLNQRAFIERTIRSVLEQDYPAVRHLVIDGGSTDGTPEVLERFRERHPERFDFLSEIDRGQAHAVNKGFDRAPGDVVGWLNSDDLYEPGCFEAVAAAFRDQPDCDVLYGRAHYVDDDDQLLGVYPTRTEFHWQTLAHECFICQPTVFLRRRVLDGGLRLDEELQMCMDYDFWIRLGKSHQVRFLDRVLASSRMYRDNKTISRRSEVYREIFHTVKKHYGRLPFSWALGRAHHVWDHGDPFFNIRRLTWVTYLIAGFFLLRHNWSRPHNWASLCHEVWVPLAAGMKNRWRARQARDPA